MANEPRKPGNNALSSIKTIIMAYLQHAREKRGKSNKIWHYGIVGRYSCAFVFQYSIVGMLLWGFEIAALIRTNSVCVYDPF